MALGIGDAILSLIGQPDPREQLVREMFGGPNAIGGQAQGGGRPGEAQRQALVAEQNVQNGRNPDGSERPPAQPSGTPEAYQSPPEISDLMINMMRRQETAAGIDRGLGLIAAGFSRPEHREGVLSAFGIGQPGGGGSGAGADAFGPNSMFGQVLKVREQQRAFDQQQRTRAAILADMPAVAAATGVPVEVLRSQYETNPEGYQKWIADNAGRRVIAHDQRIVGMDGSVIAAPQFAPQNVAAGAGLYDPNTGRLIAAQPATPPAAIATAQGVGLDPTSPEGRKFVQGIAGPAVTNIDTGTIPPGYQATRDEQGRVVRYDPIPGGPADQSQKQARQANSDAIASNTIVKAADKAVEALDSAGWAGAGTAGRVLSGISESGAAEVRRNIDVLKANASLAALQALKEQGGGLGAVTESEHALLAAKAGALDPNAPPDILRRQIEDYRETLLGIIRRDTSGATSAPAKEAKAAGGGRGAAAASSGAATATPAPAQGTAQPFDLSGASNTPAGGQWQDIGGGYRIRAK